MNYIMYSVKDEMTGKLMNPMFVEEGEYADSIAIRQFASNVNNITLWKDNPNDYSLYRVGTFSDENGAASCALEKISSGRSVLEHGTKDQN